jgi:hypothetical protein
LKTIDRGLVYRAFLAIAFAAALTGFGSAAAAPYDGGAGLVDGSGMGAASKHARPADA